MKIPFFAVSVLILLPAFGCTRESGTSSNLTMTPKAAAPAQNMTRAKSNPGAKVFFVELKDGQDVVNPVTVRFGGEGIEVAPAGEVKDNSGHYHLLIDVPDNEMPPMDKPLPFSEKILHFGLGQPAASVTLTPGIHTLRIVLAAGNHVPHDPPVISEKIKVIVTTQGEIPHSP